MTAYVEGGYHLTLFFEPQLLQHSSARPASKPRFAMNAVSKRLAGRLTLQVYAGSVHTDFGAVQPMHRKASRCPTLTVFDGLAAQWPKLNWTLSIWRWQTKLASSYKHRL